MSRRVGIASLVALCGLCGSAWAQDSTSKDKVSATGLPGDALDPYSTAGLSQKGAYVVDMVPIFSSWGTVFGMAPIFKTPRSDPAFFNDLQSGYALSQTQLSQAPYPNASYNFWDEPRLGIHPTNNTGTGSLINPAGTSVQFGAVMAGFGLRDNNVTSAVVNFNPQDPTRLYVTRVNAAVNGPNANVDNSQIGVGGIDAAGLTYFRADAGATMDPVIGPDPVAGNNLFRVNALARSSAMTNHISGNVAHRDAGATTQLATGEATVRSVPAALPSDRTAGGTGIIAGATFAKEYTYGSSAPLSVTLGHLAAGVTDTRGNISYSPQSFIAGSIGTLGHLGKFGGGATDTLLLWDVDSSGNVLRASRLTKPANVQDPKTGFQVAPGDFDHYHSQTGFRGGNGPLAIGRDMAGNGIAAATTYDSGAGNLDPFNSILVARFDPADPTGTAQWVVAAYIDINNVLSDGKPILDGPNGNEIGRLTALFNVTGGLPAGPSISAPSIDSAGNIWFLAAAALDKVDSMGQPFIDYDTVLIRAVYDPASGGYCLERVLEPGLVRQGLNSCTDYQVTFLGIADSDSVSSSTLFSNGLSQASWANRSIAGLDQGDPRTLGGVALAAEITYDVDGDGDFDDPTGVNGDPNSGDESYQVLLLVGNIDQGFGFCPADLTGPQGVPDGQIDGADFFAYLDLFASGACKADFTFDGVLDGSDFFAFLDEFVLGCR
ncbi:MAG: hypothetical protein H6811_00620 [Phycisphaeraceae bacterium]|nr:hypothetical protein [Phycisphaeraceae bacterium]